MEVKVTNPYSDLNDMIEFYQKVGHNPKYEILAHPSEYEETNVLFITHDYTFGIWVTTFGLTIHELGFQIVPKQVFELKQVEKIDYDLDHIEIFFNRKYKVKRIFINLNDMTKSYVK